MAGVSPSTVSWALNGKKVSKESMDRVLWAAQELNYHPKLSAKSLRSGKAYSIGFYIINEEFDDSRLNGFIFPIFSGISKVLSTLHYSMQFEIIAPSKIDTLRKKALENSVDGMIILPQFSENASLLIHEVADNTPTIFMQYNESFAQHHSVYIDNYKGAELAIQHLYMLGHREIALITGPEGHIDSLNRLTASLSLMKVLNMDIRPEWQEHGAFGYADGFQCMDKILSYSNHPTAVFCFNDYLAVGAIQAILSHGLRVPEDISVIGFDNSDITEACTPLLTTVAQPFLQQGQKAAELLMDIIEGKISSHTQIGIEPKLVQRNSVIQKDNVIL